MSLGFLSVSHPLVALPVDPENVLRVVLNAHDVRPRCGCCQNLPKVDYFDHMAAWGDVGRPYK